MTRIRTRGPGKISAKATPLVHVLAAGFSAWCTNLKTGRMYRFNRTALTRVEIDETKPTAQTTITDSRSEVVSVQRIGPENRKRRP